MTRNPKPIISKDVDVISIKQEFLMFLGTNAMKLIFEGVAIYYIPKLIDYKFKFDNRGKVMGFRNTNLN